MDPVDPVSSGFPVSPLPSPTSNLPPHPAHAATGGWPAPGNQKPDGPGPGGPMGGERPRRSRAAFVAVVALACAALFALSLLITVLLLQ
jgi:hypothetical protein